MLRKRSLLTGLLASFLSVAVITLLIYPLREVVPVVSTGVVYTLAVLLVSSYCTGSRWRCSLSLLSRSAHLPTRPGHVPKRRRRAGDGFEPADVAWLLENAPGKVLVLRTGEAVRAPHLSAEAT